MYFFFLFLQIFNQKIPWRTCHKRFGNISQCIPITEVNTTIFKGCKQHSDVRKWHMVECPLNGQTLHFTLSTNQFANYMFFDNESKRDEWDSSLLTLCNVIMWIIVYLMVSWRTYRLKKMVKYSVFLFISMLIVLFFLGSLTGKASVTRQIKRYLEYKPFSWKGIKQVVYHSTLMTICVLSVSNPMRWAYSTRLSYQPKSFLDTVLVSSIILFVMFFANVIFHTLAEAINLKLGLEDTNFGNVGIIYLAYIPTFIELVTHAHRFWLVTTYFFLTFVTVVYLAVEVNGFLTNILASSDLMEYRQYFTTGYCVLMAFFTSLLTYYKNKTTLRIIMFSGMLHPLVPVTQFICESICVFWIYGIRRLCDDIHFMSGAEPGMFWKLCWAVCPFVSVVHAYLIYEMMADDPWFMDYQIMGNLVYLFPAFFIVGIVIKIISFNRNDIPLFRLFEPTPDWGPPNRILRSRRKMFHPREEIRSQTIITRRVVLKQRLRDMKYK